MEVARKHNLRVVEDCAQSCGGMYKGTDDDVTTFGVRASFVSSTQVADDTIYEVVKAMHLGFDVYKDMHKAMPAWNINTAVSNPSPVPYHEGAIRYFKEVGVWKADMDVWQAEQLKAFNERAK